MPNVDDPTEDKLEVFLKNVEHTKQDSPAADHPSKKEEKEKEKEKDKKVKGAKVDKPKDEKKDKKKEKEREKLEKERLEKERLEKELKEKELKEKEKKKKKKEKEKLAADGTPEKKGFFGFKKRNRTVYALPPGVLPGLPLPICVLTDSYKATHYFQYPKARKMVAYGEFRRSFLKDEHDQRIVCYGMRYIVQTWIARPWTIIDVENAEKFFATHNAGFTKFPFPKDLFLKFIKENDGYFPVKVEAIPEGSVVYPHTPIYQITAEGEYSRLVTYLETLLTMVWYPSSVATLSRRVRTRVQQGFEKTVDDNMHFLLASRLQDFGFRGCTCVEQSVIGGAAHLLNFEGSDTMSAAYYVQFNLNDGRPVATSIPATEHSVMTAYPNEKLAIENMIRSFGTGVFAVVMDSYDYTAALEKVLPSVATIKTEKGGFMVLRPDSGNPVDVVLKALRAGEAVFGADVNSKGFKVLRGVGVIQGDGIDYSVIGDILTAAEAEGYSAQNIAYGMGAGLLQNVNRDTMSFATKLCHIVYEDGTPRNVMKAPKTDAKKFSLPGQLKVLPNEQGIPVVFPLKKDEVVPGNLLRVVYDNGPVLDVWENFDDVRKRLDSQWATFPKLFDAVSQEMRDLIVKTQQEQQEQNDAAIGGN